MDATWGQTRVPVAAGSTDYILHSRHDYFLVTDARLSGRRICGEFPTANTAFDLYAMLAAGTSGYNILVSSQQECINMVMALSERMTESAKKYFLEIVVAPSALASGQTAYQFVNAALSGKNFYGRTLYGNPQTFVGVSYVIVNFNSK